VSNELASRTGLQGGAELHSIETPLVFSGFQPSADSEIFQSAGRNGICSGAGGTTPARPDDAKLAPGDMAGMVLVQGDVSINSACTVTAIRETGCFLCGHSVLEFRRCADSDGAQPCDHHTFFGPGIYKNRERGWTDRNDYQRSPHLR